MPRLRISIFFTCWKGADPSILFLIAAVSEFAKLK
jgi:hypothetical protein